MKVGGQRNHPVELLALAYELNQCGVKWKLIERYLGDGLNSAVQKVKRNGFIRP